jgi:uncharacterized protein (DUF433 family)
MSSELGSLVVRTPGVLGGKPRINNTRIAVRTIAIYYKQGASPEEIAEQYEQLNLAQIYAALAFYHANKEEIEADIAAEQQEYDKIARDHYQTRKSA